MGRTLATKDADLQVEIAHFLISTKGDGAVPAAHIELGFEWSPRSIGKNLLDLAYRTRKLKGDPYDMYGLCEKQTSFSNSEATTYKILAYMAEQALDQLGATFGVAMKYKMAGLVMRELVEQPHCSHCNTAGCVNCNFLGRKPMTKTKRVLGLDTNHANWVKLISRAYVDIFLPMVGAAEREGARVWLRTMQERLPERITPFVAEAMSARS